MHTHEQKSQKSHTISFQRNIHRPLIPHSPIAMAVVRNIEKRHRDRRGLEWWWWVVFVNKRNELLLMMVLVVIEEEMGSSGNIKKNEESG